mgnify:CR=1 FL=1|jgi:hypothetical protein
MTVKYGEMSNLVSDTISIDQYKPKIGEANETVVVAFEVAFEQPAKDLSNLIETDVTESLDVDISDGPNADGKYMVFVEFQRNNSLYESIMNIVKVASQVTAITEWKYSYYKGTDNKELTAENLSETVLDNSEEYVLRYNSQTNEDLSRVKALAGL